MSKILDPSNHGYGYQCFCSHPKAEVNSLFGKPLHQRGWIRQHLHHLCMIFFWLNFNSSKHKMLMKKWGFRFSFRFMSRGHRVRRCIGEENIRRIEENGQLVMVTEHRVLDDRRQGHVVIKVRCRPLFLFVCLFVCLFMLFFFHFIFIFRVYTYLFENS